MLGENRHIADRMHNGLSSNLYQLQLQTGELLPNFNLRSGEVKRIGDFPVSGTAAMDIYEGEPVLNLSFPPLKSSPLTGLYLGREKVAIKVVRAVNSNQESQRVRYSLFCRVEDLHLLSIALQPRSSDLGENMAERSRTTHPSLLWLLSERWTVPVCAFYMIDLFSQRYSRYMVSPWQQNGNALSYIKKNDRIVNHLNLVFIFLRSFSGLMPRQIRGIAKGLEVLHTMDPPVVHGDIKAVFRFLDAPYQRLNFFAGKHCH